MGKDTSPKQPEDPRRDNGEGDLQPWTSHDANVKSDWQVDVVSVHVDDSESRLSRAIGILLDAAARSCE